MQNNDVLLGQGSGEPGLWPEPWVGFGPPLLWLHPLFGSWLLRAVRALWPWRSLNTHHCPVFTPDYSYQLSHQPDDDSFERWPARFLPSSPHTALRTLVTQVTSHTSPGPAARPQLHTACSLPGLGGCLIQHLFPLKLGMLNIAFSSFPVSSPGHSLSIPYICVCHISSIFHVHLS